MGKIICCDYKALEMRIAAHVWKDPKFTEAILSEDIHAAVGRTMFGKDYDDPEKQEELRVLAKNVGFGNLYGSEGYAVAEQTGLPIEQVKEYIQVFRSRFPGLIDAMEETKRQAWDPGWVTSITGRERKFFCPKKARLRRKKEIQAQLREAINFPIQCPAGEMGLLAMCEVHDWLKREGLRTLLVSNIHDEIMLDAPDSEVGKVVDAVPEIMVDLPTQETWGFTLTVPLVVDVAVGPSWGEVE